MTTTEYTSEALYTVGEKDTIISALRELQAEKPNLICFHRPVNLNWEKVTVTQFLDEVYAVAKGLIANGLQPEQRVAIMSSTRYEWTLADFAIQACGATSVPIYPSSSTSQCEWIIQDSGAVLAFAEDSEHSTRLNTFVRSGERQPDTAHLDRVFTFNQNAIADLVKEGEEAGIEQEEIEKRIGAMTSSTINSIVYTSGTTGRPKGCILDHSNWLSETRSLLSNPIGAFAGEGRGTLMFLPLAHVLARAVSYTAILGSSEQTYWSDTDTLVTEFQRAQPHMILGVPRIFEKVHAAAKAKASEAGGAKAKIFAIAEKVATEYSKALDTDKGPSVGLKIRRAIFDKLVYSKLREVLGGNLLYCISGGSALNPELMHFFRGVGVIIYEGYGLTESTAAVAVNNDQDNIIGTVGKPVGGNTARIAEDGEVELKGTVVFKGYWKNEEATKKDFTEDGFYKTGDLGTLLPTGHLKITGRKKEILVTAGGKNVSPGPMEDILRSAPLISQAMVVGDDQKFVGALITLDEEAASRFKKDNGIPQNTSVLELAKNPVLRSQIQDAINEANQTVSSAESIKKFRIVHRDFTEEQGEVTPSMKLKRFAVAEHFARDIQKIYSSK
ncbi:Long-chain-fatty-acid--CoA ligase FadD15 [Corynebacterium urogenitale]|uniref:Acyl-CoA synthetase n=1 Tax=Corynebacterium urogenitale TaxID=2487892 RepID=A0A5J6Z6Z8_9CORY|nr:long-chain fatty acid--CoA ligase [Corynebacterium urogenitale]QFQ02032.1 Long-chain-fatty-acid--CoA ligase FadD15 [Corynebacterium urogenitale]